jgi:hypothetical protein
MKAFKQLSAEGYMGPVKQYLTSVISKQIDEKGIVLWFDPEHNYGDFARSLELPNTHVAQFKDSFFALRREIEPYISSPERPRLLVYVALEENQTHDALVELKAAGSVQTFPLAVIATLALSPLIGPKNAASVRKEVEAGKLTLEDLDSLPVGEGITKGIIAVILGSGNVQDIALRFLAGEKYDPTITKKNATAELTLLLNNGFGSNLQPANTPAEIRSDFARQVLTTDFVLSLNGEVPPKLTTVKIANNKPAAEACTHLASEWRNRQDLRESYVRLSDKVAQLLQLSSDDMTLDQVSRSQTFREVEKALCRDLTQKLLAGATDEIVKLAQERQSSFWSEFLPEVQAHWALIAVAGQLVMEAERIENEIKRIDSSASSLVKIYADGSQPWCLLDTYHRHLERRYHDFDFESDEEQLELTQLVAKARQRYTQVAGLLSDSFLRRLSQEHFRVQALQQTDIYQRKVRPEFERKKTAYVWVDALRYEMGRELADSLAETFECICEPAIAAVPTVTEVGMAALLPGEEKSLAAANRAGKVVLMVDGVAVGDRRERVKAFQSKLEVPLAVVKLEELLPKPKKKLAEAIRNAGMVLMTSQEIDELCEGDNVHLARTRMDSILHDLHRAFRVLTSLGVERFVVTADHGYIFGEDLDDSMKVDPPGGETVDLHRRVWVGRGGQSSDAFMRARISDFNLGSDLEIATPWGFGAFKSPGGAKAFFHGGLSLQELVIPVLTLTPRKVQPAGVEGKLDWDLTPGSQKISTRFFSVQIKAAVLGFLEPVLPKVRVEIKAASDVISTPVSASYGFEDGTGDVQLRLAENGRSVDPNTVTLLIKDDVSSGTASVHLLDAATGVELKRIAKVEITISI